MKKYLPFILVGACLMGVMSIMHHYLENRMTLAQKQAREKNVRDILIRNHIKSISSWDETRIPITKKAVIEQRVLTNGYEVVYQLATTGYGGRLVFLVLMREQRLLDVQLVESAETPGLGDLFDNVVWIDRFKKDLPYEAVSGATITSNAIAGAISGLREYVK